MKRNLSIVAAILVFSALAYAYMARDQVKNLEEFAELTASDPLFYSPFFDHESFMRSVNLLKESEARLKRSAIENIEKADADYSDTFARVLRDHELFPIAFLSSLDVTTAATDGFLADKSERNATKLIEAYERSADEYLKAARSGVEVFDTITSYVRANRPLLYFFVDSFTSTSLVSKDYRLIEKNALALKDEVERRKDCLYGRGSCEVASPVPDTREFFEALEEKEPAHNDETAAFVLTTLPGQSGKQEVRGPYPATSSCWGEDDKESWLYVVYVTKEDAPIRAMPKVTDINYYRLISASSTDSISQAVSAKGLKFYSQLETTTYECTDLTFYPRLLSLDLAKKNLESSSTTVEEMSDQIAYQRLAENQFGALAPAYVALASYTDLLEASQHTAASFILSPQFLFTTRSAYSLTFMPFARSIWRLEDRPKYLHNQEDREKTGMRDGFSTYEELKAQGFSDELIRSSHLNQYELIDSITND